MKLLAKNAEERYQSAYGLKADLESVLANLTGLRDLSGFTPGQHDISERFQIPQKLYGREQEIATLLAAYDRVSDGATELMLVTGYAGIGKSALVHEIYGPITKTRGSFLSGKFDQLQRNIPYSALIQAFQGLMRQLLAEPEEQLAVWKETFLTALGPNGHVIIDVIPDIELILGKQPDVPELPPNQAQNPGFRTPDNNFENFLLAWYLL
jgi:predicted ATPase